MKLKDKMLYGKKDITQYMTQGLWSQLIDLIVIIWYKKISLDHLLRELMQQSKFRHDNEEGHPVCTTIPQDLVKSVKSLALRESVRISDVMTEAIEDLLIKYKMIKPDSW